MRDINVFGIAVISVIMPLFKKRIYHMLLPSGRHHDIVKTMRDFLLEEEFIQIFSAYLEEVDESHDTTQYSDYLSHWKKLMVLKYNSGDNLSDFKKVQSLDVIKDVVRAIEERPVREVHEKLLGSLKHSILSLEEWEEDHDGAEEGYRLMDDIHEKVEELELIFLEKLDHIYKTEFR